MKLFRITETDSGSIPTGGFISVGGTPYDLRVPTKLGDVINKTGNGFDDNFCISTYTNKVSVFNCTLNSNGPLKH